MTAETLSPHLFGDLVCLDTSNPWRLTVKHGEPKTGPD